MRPKRKTGKSKTMGQAEATDILLSIGTKFQAIEKAISGNGVNL